MANHRFFMDAEYASFAATAGIDEAGRGSLAGPVTTACVTWRPAEAARQPWFGELNDSKALTAETRARLYPRILEHASRVRVAIVSHILIDYMNILNATLYGFELAAPAYDETAPTLIDGPQKPPSLKWARAVVKGDQKLSAVAAAGVVAKVFRDNWMTRLAKSAPEYGFAAHKGYATAAHRRAIAKWGPSSLHRKSFRPVSEMTAFQAWDDGEPALIARASPAERERLWRAFPARYRHISPAAARLWLRAFHESGIPTLPCASEPLSSLAEIRTWNGSAAGGASDHRPAAAHSLSW